MTGLVDLFTNKGISGPQQRLEDRLRRQTEAKAPEPPAPPPEPPKPVLEAWQITDLRRYYQANSPHAAVTVPERLPQPTGDWLIAVPVWGEWYRRRWIQRGLPSIKAALEWAGVKRARFVVHTDATGELHDVLHQDFETFFRVAVPEHDIPRRLANLHRASLHMASDRECVALFNADMVVSREAFAVARASFDKGKKLVVCHNMRTGDPLPDAVPIGVGARQLLEWGWDNKHRWAEECVYGRGHIKYPALVYFDEGYDVAAHCFTLQPFAVYKDREINFTGPTADELVDCFTRREVHVVQNAEMAIVEPSQPYPLTPYEVHDHVLDIGVVEAFAPGYTSMMMCWQFAHQITVRGSYSKRAQEIADEMLARIDQDLKPKR